MEIFLARSRQESVHSEIAEFLQERLPRPFLIPNFARIRS